jgi:hypothetical protein
MLTSSPNSYNYGSTNQLMWQIRRGGEFKYTYYATALQVNKWTHVCATVETDGEMNLFKDGVKLKCKNGNACDFASCPGCKGWTPDKIFRRDSNIGRSHSRDSDDKYGMLHASLSDFTVIDRHAVTAAEVVQMMTGTTSTTTKATTVTTITATTKTSTTKTLTSNTITSTTKTITSTTKTFTSTTGTTTTKSFTTTTTTITSTTTTLFDPGNVNCVETLTPCTAACERADDRVHSVVTPAIQEGRPCKGAVDCTPGEGECPRTTTPTTTDNTSDKTNINTAHSGKIDDSGGSGSGNNGTDDGGGSVSVDGDDTALKSSNGGLIAGVVIGVLLLIGIGTATCFVCKERRQKARAMRNRLHTDATTTNKNYDPTARAGTGDDGIVVNTTHGVGGGKAATTSLRCPHCKAKQSVCVCGRERIVTKSSSTAQRPRLAPTVDEAGYAEPNSQQTNVHDGSDHLWYVADLPKEQCKARVAAGNHGDFLVRNSSSKPGAYVICYNVGGGSDATPDANRKGKGKGKGKVFEDLATRYQDGQYSVTFCATRQFADIGAIVSYWQQNPLMPRANLPALRLGNPAPCIDNGVDGHNNRSMTAEDCSLYGDVYSTAAGKSGGGAKKSYYDRVVSTDSDVYSEPTGESNNPLHGLDKVSEVSMADAIAAAERHTEGPLGSFVAEATAVGDGVFC